MKPLEASVTGFVFVDDAFTDIWSPTSDGLVNVSVVVISSDGKKQVGIGRTDKNGKYNINHIPSNMDYIIRVEQKTVPTGYEPSSNLDVQDTRHINEGETLKINFGYRPKFATLKIIASVDEKKILKKLLCLIFKSLSQIY